MIHTDTIYNELFTKEEIQEMKHQEAARIVRATALASNAADDRKRAVILRDLDLPADASDAEARAAFAVYFPTDESEDDLPADPAYEPQPGGDPANPSVAMSRVFEETLGSMDRVGLGRVLNGLANVGLRRRLTREQLSYAKEYGLDPAEYAKNLEQHGMLGNGDDK